ncbi:PREDICTED: uncharacterized protein LOC107066487 [Polistes dominula]|uniref:Uncharacterized protein LOC107066487 n=1 Tax=Polistes dominula TaxID=743375 RepID=A0ABM1I8U0_POLDO|nr:PREDICTED: uncharacterized protein LOC107066487 [Polistes dominula]
MNDKSVIKNPSCSSAFKSSWSKNDKFLLLKSLKLYGHKNVAAISTFLTNKSQDDIKDTINCLKIKSKVVNKKKSLINDWIESKLIKKKNKMIRQALLFISLFEKNSFDNKISDYREIYRYLYKLSCGMKNTNLSELNQDILYKTLTEIDYKITTKPQKEEIMLHIEKLRNKNIKTYPGKKAANK